MIGLTYSSSFTAMRAQADAAPYLTAERERELLLAVSMTQCKKSIRELAVSHFRYVISYARRFVSYGLDIEDLVQQGCIGLLDAISRYNAVQHPIRLITYAKTWIKAAILEYVIANSRMVKVATTKARRKLFFNLSKYKSTSTALSLTSTEVARAASDLNVSEELVREMELRLFGGEVSLDIDPEEDEPMVDIAEEGSDPEDILLQLETDNRYNQVIETIEQLDDRSQYIVYNRLVAEKKVQLRIVAEHLGVSTERVRQLEKQALSKIQDLMKAA